jgi:dihydrodipicolinate synthase/N-acetylneuraminate lyase
MQAEDLDLAYTRLCEAMGRTGEARAPLLLAMVCLGLISRQQTLAPVLALIEEAEAHSRQPEAPRALQCDA